MFMKFVLHGLSELKGNMILVNSQQKNREMLVAHLQARHLRKVAVLYVRE